MTRVLHRISRGLCPAADRRWVDALFAELDAIDSLRGRALWLLGAIGIMLDRNVWRLAAAVTPASMACLVAAVCFGALAIIEYEGLALEDDWYGPIAAGFAAGLIGVSVLNVRRRETGARP